jgi:hypothetical protein
VTIFRKLIRSVILAFGVGLLMSGCGGGSSSPTSPTSGGQSSIIMSGNQVPVDVAQNPNFPNAVLINVPFVTVTLCDAIGTCENIDHVILDTGSVGLRVAASAIAGLNLPAVAGAQPGQQIGECAGFASGVMWGSVRVGTVKIAGEAANNIGIEVFGDTNFAPRPASCSGGLNISSAGQLYANGVLGIGNTVEDRQAYYTCTASTCSPSTPATSVTNPIAAFAVDNNGAILSFGTAPVSGTATGNLTFGLDTQPDNSLEGMIILPASATGGYFTASMNGTSYSMSFIDSGSTANFLSLATPPPTDSSGYFQPASPDVFDVSIPGATSQGYSTSVTIAALHPTPQQSAYAFAGAPSGWSQTLDLGLPFFFGRRVAMSIVGRPNAHSSENMYAVDH